MHKLKNVIAVLGVILFMLLPLNGCKDSSRISEIDTTKDSLPDMKIGQEFEITIDAYSGTAYSWSYEVKPNSGVEFVTRKFIPTDENPDNIGGGQFVYTFRAIRYGNYQIKFYLQIPWESDSLIKISTFNFRITE